MYKIQSQKVKKIILYWLPSIMALFAYSTNLLTYGQHYHTYKSSDILFAAMINAGISAIFAFATIYVIIGAICWLIEKIVNIFSKAFNRSK